MAPKLSVCLICGFHLKYSEDSPNTEQSFADHICDIENEVKTENFFKSKTLLNSAAASLGIPLLSKPPPPPPPPPLQSTMQFSSILGNLNIKIYFLYFIKLSCHS